MASDKSIGLELEPWRAINDGVMGGVSSGEMVATAEGLRFQGVLSLENNGGFASVRRLLAVDLSGFDGVRVKIRGDGRTYQLRFRQDGGFDGVSWRAEFSTNGKWQSIELPFQRFEPVWRGRPVPEAGPLVAGQVRQLGFLLADKQPGVFGLDINAIEFWGAK